VEEKRNKKDGIKMFSEMSAND